MAEVDQLRTLFATADKADLYQNKDLLLRAGLYYYERVIPTQINRAFVLETEKYLNELYVAALQAGRSDRIIDSILEALALAGSLSMLILERDFDSQPLVSKIQQLGLSLSRLSGDITTDAPPPHPKSR